MKKIVLLFILLSLNVFAQDDSLSVVAVGEATLERDKVLVQDPYY